MVKMEETDRIRNILDDIGRGPRHSFGQNFLTNRSLASQIIDSVPKDHYNNIVEIGPGMGILTLGLLERGATVTAIEKDAELADKLEDITPEEHIDRLHLIRDDATRRIARMMREENCDFYLVSNLPFNISSRIMGDILDNTDFVDLDHSRFKGATIMFQLEFARRLVSEHGSKKYGRISVMFRSKMDSRFLMKVPKGMFYPPPKVDAAVVQFNPKEKFDNIPTDPDIFNKLVHVVFLNRRKKLKNTVNPPSMGIDLGKDDVIWILDDMEISNLRPEDLDPDKFITLSDRISELK